MDPSQFFSFQYPDDETIERIRLAWSGRKGLGPPDQYEECVLCGAPVAINKMHYDVHLADGGTLMDVSLPDEDDDQGWFVIGPNCRQRLVKQGAGKRFFQQVVPREGK